MTVEEIFLHPFFTGNQSVTYLYDKNVKTRIVPSESLLIPFEFSINTSFRSLLSKKLNVPNEQLLILLENGIEVLDTTQFLFVPNVPLTNQVLSVITPTSGDSGKEDNFDFCVLYRNFHELEIWYSSRQQNIQDLQQEYKQVKDLGLIFFFLINFLKKKIQQMKKI